MRRKKGRHSKTKGNVTYEPILMRADMDKYDSVPEVISHYVVIYFLDFSEIQATSCRHLGPFPFELCKLLLNCYIHVVHEKTCVHEPTWDKVDPRSTSLESSKLLIKSVNKNEIRDTE